MYMVDLFSTTCYYGAYSQFVGDGVGGDIFSLLIRPVIACGENTSTDILLVRIILNDFGGVNQSIIQDKKARFVVSAAISF